MDANYVPVLCSSVCAIHNWTDGINILQRVMSVDIGSVVVSRCFKTQNDALCWLTDPVQTEAVACSAEHKTFAGELASFDSQCWLALVSRVSATCVSVDAAELTIGALRNAAEGACVVRRFPSAAEAWRWVDAGTARSLLDVVCWVPSELVKSVTYPRMTASTTLVNVDDDARLTVLATRPASSASTPASSKSSTPTVSRFECHASSLASTARSLSLSASSMPPSALYPASGRVSVPTALGFKGRPDMTAARNGPPARTTSRWTRGIGQASQGTQFAASAPLARQAADQGRPGGTGSRKTVQQFSFRPLGRPTRGQQRLSPLPARPGPSRPSAGALPSVPPVAQEVAVGVATLSPTGSIEQGTFDDDAWERELDEVSDLVDVVIRRAESAETAEARPVKRAKVSNLLPGEVPSALKPPSSSKDRTSGMLPWLRSAVSWRSMTPCGSSSKCRTVNLLHVGEAPMHLSAKSAQRRFCTLQHLLQVRG